MIGVQRRFVARLLGMGAFLAELPEVRRRIRQEREQMRQRRELDEIDRWLVDNDPDRPRGWW